MEPHPVIPFKERKEISTLSDLAEILGIPHGTLKGMVRGFAGCSAKRAEQIEDRTGGDVKAIDVLRWHLRWNRQSQKRTAPV